MFNLSFIGNICQDSVIKEFNGQKLYAFTVAVNESYTDKQGQKHEKVTFISCLKYIHNDQSTLGFYLKQGVKVWVSGTPSARAYATKDGNMAAGLNCKVSELELLSSQKRTENPVAAAQTVQTVTNPSQPQNVQQNPNYTAGTVQTQPVAQAQPAVAMPVEPENDLPF